MYRCDFLKHHQIQGPKIPQRVSSRYDDALQTNGDIPVHVLYNVSPAGSRERLCQRRSSKIASKKEAILKTLLTTLSEVKFQERTQALLQGNKTKKTNLALRNTIPPSSFKSQRNLNEKVAPNTVTTIAKPNLKGAAHNITRKGALTLRHTRKSKIKTKERKPNHVFRSRVGLSAHTNTRKQYSRNLEFLLTEAKTVKV